MAFRDGKTFILCRKDKKIHINEKDLSLDRISNLFKVARDTLYLEDPAKHIFFAENNGKFPIVDMEDYITYMVEGDDSQEGGPSGTSTSGRLVNYEALCTMPGPSTSYNTLPRPLINKRQLPPQPSYLPSKKTSIRRPILLAEFDNDLKPVITGTVYLHIDGSKASSEGVAELVKEYTNSSETFVICDGNGFEIIDSPGTKGADFWRASAKRFLAVETSKYAELLTKREKKMHKKKKTSTSSFDFEEEIMGSLDESVKLQKENSKDCKSVQDKCEEIHASLVANSANLEEKIEEIGEKIRSFQSAVLSDILQISTIKDMIADSVKADEIVKSIRVSLTCNLCQKVPENGVIFSQCCNQFLGCQTCIERWLDETNSCPLCRVVCTDKIVKFHGLDDVLNKL